MKNKLLVLSIVGVLLLGLLTIFPSTTAKSYDSTEDGIECFAEYDGKLYAGGRGEGKIYVYDGNTWNLSYDDLNSTTSIFSLAVYNDKLYAGSTLLYGGTTSLYVYDGNAWSICSIGSIEAIVTLAVYNNKLYAGDSINYKIYEFDGNIWNLSYTFSTQKPEILTVYDNNLYLSGYGGVIYIYDGNNWNISYSTLDCEIESFIEYNGKLYAGGRNVGNIYVYDGNTWNISHNVYPNFAYSLAVYNEKLYTGGNIVYTYDGNYWNVTFTLGYFTSMLVYDDKLYAASGGHGLIYEFDGNIWNLNFNSPNKPSLISPINYYINEDFNTIWLPTNWEEIVYSGDGHWEKVTNTSFNYGLLPYSSSLPHASASSYEHPTQVFNVSIFTPKINITSTTHNIFLGCGILFYHCINSSGYIRVWSENKTILEETIEFWNFGVGDIAILDKLDINNYSSLYNIQIEFYYTTNNNTQQFFYSVDNVKIYKTPTTNIELNTTLSIHVIDTDGDNMSIDFYWDDDTLIQSFNNILSGSDVETDNLSLLPDTTYTWYALAYDGEYQTLSDTFTFTTVLSETPISPVTPTTDIFGYLLTILILGFGGSIYILTRKKRKR